MSDNIFRAIEDKDAFISYVGDFLRSTPGELSPVLSCKITVDEERLKYAHTEYVQGVLKFSMYLQSGDPDHHKRAGALLHALYLSKPIVAVEFDPDLENVDTLMQPPGVTYGLAEGALSFGHFFDDYHNEFAAFAIAYGTCRQYVEVPRDVDFDFIHTACTYLKNNGNLSVESLFMMFKSLMT